jgi:hypothetical protein
MVKRRIKFKPHIKQALSMPFNLCNVVFLWVKVEFGPVSDQFQGHLRQG